MGSRRKARECALQILYQMELQQAPTGVSAQLSLSAISPAKALEATESYFKNFEVPPAVHDFSTSIVRGVMAHAEKIDAVVQSASKKWKLERMSLVDRNILRLATYEMVFGKTIDSNIVINEAIEIAKKYGNTESSAFVNGILDGISKNLKKA